MRTSLLLLFIYLFAFVSNAQNESKLIRVDNFKSQFVKERNVEIWLPKEYFDNKAQYFPVVYMHDGQNLFNPETSSTGIAMDIDETADRIISDELTSPFIIVASWSTDNRFMEYFPEKAAQYFSKQDIDEIEEAWKIKKIKKSDFLGDEYLQFITAELKPYIDKNYRTLKSPGHTAIAGGSMGGLISLYAICEYPDVFGQAACISTHWPILLDNGNIEPSDAVRKYLEENLPDPESHRIYFDHGTHTVDQYYGVHQQMVDQLMRAKGYTEGTNWVTKIFEGAEHNEKSMGARMDVIFEFLFPLKTD